MTHEYCKSDCNYKSISAKVFYSPEKPQVKTGNQAKEKPADFLTTNIQKDDKLSSKPKVHVERIICNGKAEKNGDKGYVKETKKSCMKLKPRTGLRSNNKTTALTDQELSGKKKRKSPRKLTNLTASNVLSLQKPIYQNIQSNDNENTTQNLYDFIPSPSEGLYGVSKKKRIRKKAPSPLSFLIFSSSKINNVKRTRKKKYHPPTKFLLVSKTSNKKIVNNNFPTRKPLPPMNIDTKIDGKVPKVDKVKDNTENFITQRIKKQNLNEKQNKHEIINSTRIIDIDDNNLNSSDNFHLRENDKTLEEEIETCFGFESDDNQQEFLQSPTQSSENHFPNPKNITLRKKTCLGSNKLLKNKPQIISNILLKTSPNWSLNESEIFVDGSNGPKANSTMIHRPDIRQEKSWRLEDYFCHNNSHNLVYKPSCLPAIDQDIIIDYKFDEKMSRGSKTPVVTNREPSCHQTSVLDFVETNRDFSVEPKEKTLSFFENNALSPLKNIKNVSNVPVNNYGTFKKNVFKDKSPKKRSPLSENVDKENIPTNNVFVNKSKTHSSPLGERNMNLSDSNERNTPPKPVLGENTPNSRNKVSMWLKDVSPIVILSKVTISPGKKLNVDNTFDFDSLSPEDKFLNLCYKDKVPTRISIKEIKKVLISNSDQNEKENKNSSPERGPDEGDTEKFKCEEDEELKENGDGEKVGLFDELRSVDKPVSKTYQKRKAVKRRQRIPSNTSESQHSLVPECPKRRKKNMMTKEEEEKFEKWAENLNSEFEEIDKFDLEVE